MADVSVTEQMKDLKMDEKKNVKDGGKKKNKNAGGDAGGRAELSPQPQYIEERLSIYNKLKAEHDALLAEKAAKDSKPIKITLPDGTVVDGESWKTTPYQVACGIRPLEENCSLVLLKFDDEEAQAVYWHSSAHIMGEAMERVYGGCLCYGPPIENGFYYDMFLENEGVSSNDFPCLENLCKKIIKEKQPFERLEVKKETLLEMFKNSSTYWEGKADMESLQRLYGISFPDPKMLKEWEKFQEEAKNRDHRKLGREQDLFFFHDLSPGSCFFLPKGAYIYNTLIEFIRSEYRKRGFQEVVTPNIYNSKLWQTSGHWQHYSENMFSFEVEKEIFALKPMNCPGHCLMFDHRPRSWRELPLRLADFGVLHRNELSGALTGLTRQLENSLNDFGEKWVLNPGDGAFYGPKIDIQIKDAIGRYHQCATIQLDFQLPIRFNLTFVSHDGDDKKRPVIIHRAILGSVERMIAILTENYGGKWPLWLSPRQVMVVPVGPTCDEYAQRCREEHTAGADVAVYVKRTSAFTFTCDVQIPEGNELTPKEKQLREKAKPETEFQAQLFQAMASIRFALNDPITSTIEVKNSVHQRSSVSSQCG
ncbi:hypothetical protein cypCar_00021484 [Cyprinus carpio]|nr:hypothetical protein cypCar_00021484 [Cyprinus carpio]